MTVLPGSLDYLYYNGILDHIPYEAYETGVGFNSGYNQSQMGAGQYINGSQYMNSAMQGNMYSTYNSSSDSFVRKNNTDYKQGENYSFAKKAFGYNDGVGKDADYELKAFGQEGKSFRESLVESAKSTVSGFSNAPTFVKGLIAGGVMVGTLFCLLKGKKKPPVANTNNTSFWSKLNPKNWFKKKV